MQKIRRKFRRIFIVWGREEISRIIRLIIAKAIIVYSSKMGKEIRQPEPLLSSTFRLWFPLLGNRFLGAFFIPLCIDIPIPKTRVKLSTNVMLSNPILGFWHEFVLPFQNREKNILQRNHFLIQNRYIWSPYRWYTNYLLLKLPFFHSLCSFWKNEWLIY